MNTAPEAIEKKVEFVSLADCRDETSTLVVGVLIVVIAAAFCLCTLQGFAWWRITR